MGLSDKLKEIAKLVQQLGNVNVGSPIWKCLCLLIIFALLTHAVEEPMEKHFHPQTEVNTPFNGQIAPAASTATTAAMPIFKI